MASLYSNENFPKRVVDFIRLHAQTLDAHAGIIVCTRDDANPQAFAERIHAALIIPSDLAGQLIRIVRPMK